MTIDGVSFDAIAANVGVETHHDHNGMPQMGSMRTVISCTVDIHDDVNMPFLKLRDLFQLANVVTRDKIKDMKIEFWKDERQEDAVCSFTFRGWISSFHLSGGGGENHMLDVRLVPELDKQQYVALTMAN